MITNLRAQNFKSWKDTGYLRLAPLTGLFGTNSSGKSSILQVLLMLKQTVESSDPNRVLHLGGDRNSYVDLGTFADVIHGHDLDNSLALTLEYATTEGPFRFDVAINEKNQRIIVSELVHSSEGHSRKRLIRPDGLYEDIWDGVHLSPGPVLQLFSLLSEIAPRAGDIPVASPLALTLKAMAYLGPLRIPPQRSYLFRGTRPRDVGNDGAGTIEALLAAQDEYPAVEKYVAEWLVAMNLIHSFRLRPIAPNRRDHEVLIKTTEDSPEVLLTDVGFGISQLLPVLVLCYYVPEGTTILLEQPELHLHPSAQSVLADVFIDVVKNRKLQIIFESHSEHLLRRIQRRIAEEQFPAQDASMYFCHIEKGESHATPLELTDEGFIKNWPPDFFGDEMGEVAALAKESIRRRRQAR